MPGIVGNHSISVGSGNENSPVPDLRMNAMTWCSRAPVFALDESATSGHWARASKRTFDDGNAMAVGDPLRTLRWGGFARVILSARHIRRPATIAILLPCLLQLIARLRDCLRLDLGAVVKRAPINCSRNGQ